MIRFDFSTYNFVDSSEEEKLESLKPEIIKKFNDAYMTGWRRKISDELINKINETAKKIKEVSNVLVVIGIGGSFLGCYSFGKMFKKYFNDKSFEIIYAGISLSSKYLCELKDYLKGKDFSVNVISKSGTTMETNITYTILKELLIEKYGEDGMSKRIIVTTDKQKGTLREEVQKYGYTSFEMPDDIGGRYSFITPAHLLPLSLNFDISKIVKGYYEGEKLIDEAYKYACVRTLLYRKGKYIENFCVYEPNMYYFTEWLKQLFGETEGKDNKGIFPVSTVNTRDLHSLGQFIQEGTKIIFETFIKVLDSNKINFGGKDLHGINNLVMDSVIKAHHSGSVPCNIITIDKISEENIAMLMYFFMLAASFSALIIDVDPFNQPGVEVYKSEVRKALSEK